MQLKRLGAGKLSCALGLMTANLLAAAGAHAQTAPTTVHVNDPDELEDPGSDLASGRTRIDSMVLFYQEAGGRVKVTEPVANITLNGSNGDTLSLKLTSDTLTGASPNGAAPWRQTQTFVTPTNAPGTSSTVTSASGHSTIVTIPGTGTVARQYTTAPNTLPVDAGFQDQRYAADLGYSHLFDDVTRFSVGASISNERDYRSYSGTLGLSRDFNDKNITLSASVNYEYDQSAPHFGIPTPFTVMNASPKGPDETKSVTSVVAGLTQVMNRYWLAQLNYSWGTSTGYQTDPYRVISVVNATTGAPVNYLYENRPDKRIRQSIYFGNKIALGPTFLDASARAYHDSWGITSYTAELSDRIPLGSRFYVEPGARYYSQTKADFFHNYLISGSALPDFASSDNRLDRFTATTASLKLGFRVNSTGEIYLMAEDYKQNGDAHPAGVISGLANQNLFGGSNATAFMIGYTFAFQ